MMTSLNSLDNDDIIEEISEEIRKYKQDAIIVTTKLKDVENYRTRIMNHIEELVHNKKLDRRTAHRLEDGLKRPYSKLIFML